MVVGIGGFISYFFIAPTPPCSGGSCGQPGRTGNMHDVCTEIEIKSIADAMVTNGMQIPSLNTDARTVPRE